MDFPNSSVLFAGGKSSFLVALAASISCFFFAGAVVFRIGKSVKNSESKNGIPRQCEEMALRLNGGAEESQAGMSMMEQLVPEITSYALTYLDYQSLCCLAITSSFMRKAANDDNAWKAVYLKLLIFPTFFLDSVYSYNEVIESWQVVLRWEHVANFQVGKVRIRVLSDVAWVTMSVYIDFAPGPFNVTNVYEFHNGRWCMVHHHTTALLIHGGG
ncbi:nuclear transport factor 2 family protein [Striga asiatica]|uniref:Nuclear transport factor 2 family protein n=1 Tax=Striga asiatica TaxID=4170 RepID=A0A5A7Q8F6_STRAF|nr:nuclear transport factor 2 family protein [Striga asiatica]